MVWCIHKKNVQPQLYKEERIMEYVKLGNTGLDVSRLCLGCMGFGDPEAWTHKWVLR
jgi:hypothetical protein